MKNLILALLFAAVTPLVACHQDDGPNQQDDKIEFRVEIGDQDIDVIHYVISQAGVVIREADANVAGATNTAVFHVGGLPAGDNYTISISAETTDELTSCTGTSAPFSVSPGVTVSVSVLANCVDKPPATGDIDVNASFNECPTIDAVNVSPLSSPVGGVINFSATATDPEGTALAFTWSSEGTDFSTASSFDYGCAVAGDHDVLLTITDSLCSAEKTTTVSCTTP